MKSTDNFDVKFNIITMHNQILKLNEWEVYNSEITKLCSHYLLVIIEIEDPVFILYSEFFINLAKCVNKRIDDLAFMIQFKAPTNVINLIDAILCDYTSKIVHGSKLCKHIKLLNNNPLL